MLSSRVVIYLLWVTQFMPTILKAEVHSYDPYSTIYLGAGFNPEKPEEAHYQCVTYDSVWNVDTSGAIKTTFDASIIRSREDLYRHLSISSSASARYKFFGGSASMSFTDDFNFHSDSIVWIIKGQSFYGRYQMKNPRLNDEAQGLIDSNRNSAFARKCGTKFINQENRSVLIAAIFSIENVSQEHKQKLTSEFKASISGGLFEGSAAGSYKRFFSEASKRSQIKMSIYAIGGSGITRLSGLMTQGDDLNKVQSILADYVGTLSSDNAAPLSYVSGSMEVFGWKGKHDPNIQQRDRVLSQIYYRYKETNSAVNRINDVLASFDTPLWSYLSDTDYNTYLKQRDDSEGYLSDLTQAADNCYYDDKCGVPASSLSRVKWPIQQADKCEMTRMSAYLAKQIDEITLVGWRRLGFAPIFKDSDDPSSGIVAAGPCN